MISARCTVGESGFHFPASEIGSRLACAQSRAFAFRGTSSSGARTLASLPRHTNRSRIRRDRCTRCRALALSAGLKISRQPALSQDVLSLLLRDLGVRDLAI